MSNLLAKSKSPYLLQHKDNPVNWMPWSQEALQMAKSNNQLIIVSIGYSSCHWCHVMAHESFEDEEVATLMNRHFVNIKVDREERPDIDLIYMNAAMAVNGHGGWPLNAIALPDGRPIFAGTYYPKENWMHILQYFYNLYQKEPEKLIKQAEDILNGIGSIDAVSQIDEHQSLDERILNAVWENWLPGIDKVLGGRRGAPKFIMPNNYEFLLKYAFSSKRKDVSGFVKNTLDKIALGGINDVISGGFFRYSTDSRWHIPHFEKMLYDNAQLLSLYAQAYRFYKDELYLKVLYSISAWLKREMKAVDGGYFSALDADSEGGEGRYYIFTWEDLSNILGEDIEVFAQYYQCSKNGNWENGLNHLHSDLTAKEFCKRNKLDENTFNELIQRCQGKLLNHRNERIRPGLDDKRISGWNALLITGFVNAYWASKNIIFLNNAIELENFISQKMKNGEGLWHTYNKGEAYVEAYLSDYAPFIKALIDLYQATFKEDYLLQALHYTEYVLEHFYDKGDGIFYLTSNRSETLIHRPKEMSDNVISASNSILARVLWQLAIYFDRNDLKDISQQTLQLVLEDVMNHGTFYAEWASLLWEQVHPYFETVLTHSPREESLDILSKNYLPQVLWMGLNNRGNSKIPLLSDKKSPFIYVCRHQTCQAPMESIGEMLTWVENLQN